MRKETLNLKLEPKQRYHFNVLSHSLSLSLSLKFEFSLLPTALRSSIGVFWIGSVTRGFSGVSAPLVGGDGGHGVRQGRRQRPSVNHAGAS